MTNKQMYQGAEEFVNRLIDELDRVNLPVYPRIGLINVIGKILTDMKEETNNER